MFQFTTTTVINSEKDLSTGKPLWSFDTKNNEFRVKRVANFKKKNVAAIYKTEASAAEPAKVTIDMSNASLTNGNIGRISLYIGLSQASQESTYANDFYTKGKPFTIEFECTSSMDNDLAKLIKNINKYQLLVYGEKILNVSASTHFLTFEAVNEYQRFKKLNIEKFNAEAFNHMGNFEVTKSLDQISVESSKSTVNGSTEGHFVGKEGTGTYSFLLHNLRIPTFENNRPFGVARAEAPIPGALYDEYVVHYSVNRGILGSNGVGDQVTSMTTHVFYVRQGLGAAAAETVGETTFESETFDAAIAHLGTVTTVTKAPTVNPVTVIDSASLNKALEAKQDKLVSGENIKTINSTPILGSGDLVVPGA